MGAMVLREQLVGADCGVGAPGDSYRVDPESAEGDGAVINQPACGLNSEDHMALRAGSGTPDPARPRFGPPFSTHMCELSITALGQSSAPGRAQPR